MSLNRIYAIILQNFYILRHNLDRQSEIFYWVIIDMLLWGVTSLYFDEVGQAEVNIIFSIVSAVIFWYFLWSAQNEVNMGVLQQIWYKNFVNIFSTPLKFAELISSLIISSIVKSILTVSFGTLIAGLVFGVRLLDFGLWIFPLAGILMAMGWIYAFTISGFILRVGTSAQAITWSLVFVLSPFSAVYFPVSILPGWAQTVASLFPSSYVFESMREYVGPGTISAGNLVTGALLAIVYLCISYAWLRISFNSALNKGLVDLK
jgi:ABC-2 type transport system permease protein